MCIFVYRMEIRSIMQIYTNPIMPTHNIVLAKLYTRISLSIPLPSILFAHHLTQTQIQLYQHIYIYMYQL